MDLSGRALSVNLIPGSSPKEKGGSLRYCGNIQASREIVVILKKLNPVKTYSIIKESTNWSTDKLIEKVEKILNQRANDGYEIVTVAFGVNMWWMPTAYITVCK